MERPHARRRLLFRISRRPWPKRAGKQIAGPARRTTDEQLEESMQLLTSAQVQFEPFKRQFKYRIYSVSLALSLAAGIAITALVLVVRAWNESAWVGVFIGGWIAFWFGPFSWMIWTILKARLRSTSWPVRTATGRSATEDLVWKRIEPQPALPGSDRGRQCSSGMGRLSIH